MASKSDFIYLISQLGLSVVGIAGQVTNPSDANTIAAETLEKMGDLYELKAKAEEANRLSQTTFTYGDITFKL